MKQQPKSFQENQVRNDFVIRIGGDTAIGGVISTGENFTAAAARLGFHVFTFRSSPSPLHAEDGSFIHYAAPFQRIARQELDFVRGTNVLVLGLMAGLFGLPVNSLEELVRRRDKRRAELVEKNLQALAYGYEYTKQIRKEDQYYLGTSDHVRRLVMSGNDAITAGALHAGCRFFAGYPITPASDILESMARELPKMGGLCLPAEDEMAALGSCIGASYGGVKAMTATSGPGFSLMTELLGLSSMTEIPVVLVDAQRAGPSTGLPPKPEQSDLFHAPS